MNKLHFKEKYQELVKHNYKKHFKNIFEIPAIKKVTINVGVSKLLKTNGAKVLENIMQYLYNITYQKALIIRAKKSCDGFGVKIGDITHLKITLRKQKMYDFLTKLILFDLPRSKDFIGFNISSFDKNGNFTIGINDCSICHGIDKKNLLINFGFNITITTNSNKDNSLMLFKDLHFIFNE